MSIKRFFKICKKNNYVLNLEKCVKYSNKLKSLSFVTVHGNNEALEYVFNTGDRVLVFIEN